MPATTHEYLQSLCDPVGKRNVGLPSSDNSTYTSLKQHVFGKGTLAVGTAGFGFISLSPGSAVGNGVCGTYSDATFAGTSISAVGAGSIGLTSNSMFAPADFGPDPLAQFRVVSALLRVRYSGTELNRGGTVYQLQQPRHQPMTGETAASVAAYQQAAKYAVSREWSNVVYCPLNTSWTASTTAGTYTNNFMSILMESAPGNTFDYEFFVNFEITGRNVRGQTACVNDPVGYGAIAAAMAEQGGNYKGSPAKMENTIFSRVKSFLVSASTWIGENLPKTVEVVVEHAPALLGAAAALL